MAMTKREVLALAEWCEEKARELDGVVARSGFGKWGGRTPDSEAYLGHAQNRERYEQAAKALREFASVIERMEALRRTHCKHGHDLLVVGTYSQYSKKKRRMHHGLCLQCKRASNRKWKRSLSSTVG